MQLITQPWLNSSPFDRVLVRSLTHVVALDVVDGSSVSVGCEIGHKLEDESMQDALCIPNLQSSRADIT
jgi:hypothetical protein